MKAAAPKGHHAKKGPLAQELVLQQKLLQGGKMDQYLPTTQAGDQRIPLAWAR